MFLDQICSPDGCYLQPYTITKQVFADSKKGRTPNWYNKLVREITWSQQNLRLIDPLPSPPIQSLNVNTPEISTSMISCPRNQWVVYWDITSSSEIYGRVLEQENSPGAQSIFNIQHYTAVNIYQEHDRTPRRRTPILQPCKGCSLHTYNVANPLICTIKVATTNLSKFNIHAPKHIPRLQDTNKKKTWRYPTVPFLTLKTIAFNNYLRLNSSSYSLTQSININDSLSLKIDNNSNFNDSHSLFYFSNFFFGNNDFNHRLYEIAKSFSPFNQFIFYSDGSLNNQGLHKSKLGFGWIELATHNPQLTFSGCTANQPSSSKAELFAILTIIISCPGSSFVDIYADSKNVIDNFRFIMNDLTSLRKILKMFNHSVWRILKHLIKIKHLTAKLYKVKSHSGNHWNDVADDLAKTGCSDLPVFVHPKATPDSLLTPTFNFLGPLDSDMRKWTKHTLNLTPLISLIESSSNHDPVLSQYPIDWIATSTWIQYNNDTSADVSSEYNDRLTGAKIKSLTFSLPTADIQQKFFHNLYPNTIILCPLCKISGTTINI